jgi:hypothetical protein
MIRNKLYTRLLCEMTDLYVIMYIITHYDFWMRHISFKALRHVCSLCTIRRNAHIEVFYAPFHKAFMNIYAFIYNSHKVHGKLNFRSISCEMKRSVILFLRIFNALYFNIWTIYVKVCVCIYSTSICIYVHTSYYFIDFYGLSDETEEKFERTFLSDICSLSSF